MEYKKIIFGTWPLSGDFTNTFDKDRGISLLNYALEKGITNFDTAPNYGMGKAESLLGNFIKNNSKKKIEITTKIGNSSSNIKSFEYDDILNELDQSIQRLNKVPERLLIHNPRLEQVKLFELYQRLKSRLLGIEIGLSLARFSKYDIDFLSNFPTIQYDHNIFYNELKNINLNCKIQARSIFASGILTSKYIKKVCDNPDFKFLVDDKRSEWYKPPRSHMISAVTKIMHHLLINNYADYSIEKAAFKFVESCKPNYLVLGFSNISHVDQVLSWVECKSICVNLFKNLNLISSSKIQLW